MSTSLKLIERFHIIHNEDNKIVSMEAKVYWDTEWEEYVVRVFKGGIEQVLASYHTNNKDDALMTAQLMIN